jgi:phospholipid/cholesterol/gamma-HCH transport system substrate-binding protein
MPVPERRTEQFVGIFLLIGFILLGSLILQFGKFRNHMAGHYSLTLVFDDASGVIKGSEVSMGGAHIGQVEKLPALNDAVRVEVQLSIADAIRIPVGSTFQINSATLLGDKLIVVTPPTDRSHGAIEPGSRIEGAGPSGLDAIQNNASTVVRDVLGIIKSAEKTLVKFDTAADEIQSMAHQLEEVSTKINRSILADQNLNQLDRTVENLATTSEDWKNASRQLEPTLTETRAVVASAQRVASDATATLKSANETLARLKPILTGIPDAVETISNTSKKIGKTFEHMNQGEGLLGAMATDNDVALDAKAFMHNLKQHGILLYRNSAPEPVKKPSPKMGGTHR